MPTSIFHKSTSWLLLALLALSAVLGSVVAQPQPQSASTTTTAEDVKTTDKPTPTVSDGKIPTITVANLPDHTITFDIFGITPPPACAFHCKSFERESFTDNVIPCESVTTDEEKIKCLCTDRPYLKHIFNCIFKSCGPAINDAIRFGYQLCGAYNLELPAPAAIIQTLGLDHPPAMDFESKIEDVKFSDKIPVNEKGARADVGTYSVSQPFYSTTATAVPGSGAGRVASGSMLMGGAAVVGVLALI